MVASDYAFANAWGLLKALPEEQGYLGTVPRPLQGLIARRGGQMGDVRHEPTFRQFPDEEGRMRRETTAVDLPIEVGEGQGERVPRGIKPLRQDVTPIQERQATMQGYTPMVATRSGPSPVGPEGLSPQQITSIGASETGGLQGLSERQLSRAGLITPMTNVSMANIPGYETMPEEGFYTPREQMESREGMEQAAGRQLTGGQRGGRMSLRGGSQSGLNLLQGGKTAEGKKIRGLTRRATDLGNVEGVSRGARLGGRSRAFLPQEVKDEQKPMSRTERLAEMARMAAMNNPNVQVNMPKPTPKPQEDKPPREENLETGGRAARAAQRVEESKEAQSEKPRLDFATDPMTMQMFSDPSSPASQAAIGELENRMRLAEAAKFKTQLAQIARNKGSAGSAEQSQIDRQA
tara:strand:+ start:1929 stop:3146 length:1218 start_codon:yes stop_codon:yes gene_type:complete